MLRQESLDSGPDGLTVQQALYCYRDTSTDFSGLYSPFSMPKVYFDDMTMPKVSEDFKSDLRSILYLDTVPTYLTCSCLLPGRDLVCLTSESSSSIIARAPIYPR